MRHNGTPRVTAHLKLLSLPIALPQTSPAQFRLRVRPSEPQPEIPAAENHIFIDVRENVGVVLFVSA